MPQPTLPLPELELPRFQVFVAHSVSYVLRDNQTETDYPFQSKTAATKAVKTRMDLSRKFLGKPAGSDVYGVAFPPILQSA